jgi:hypothetical protein
MDFGSPVAGANTAVNPLQTLSSVLGIKQQQQNLQTSQYQQQTAQAQAIQQQQVARETQAGAALLSDPVGNGIIDKDGNPTANAQTIIQRAMPTTGAIHYGNIVNAAKAKVELTNAANNLRSNERMELANTIGGGAADKNNQLPDIQDQVTALVESKKGTDAYKDYQNIANTSMDVLNKAQTHPALEGQPEPWRTAALGLQRTILGAPGVVGAGGVANPTSGLADAGPAYQPYVQQSPLMGGQVTQVGQPIRKALGPTQTIPYVAASSAAASGASARASGVAGSDIDRANQVSASIQPSTAAIETTKKIDDLADQINSGKVADWVSKAAAAAGYKDSIAYARQLLEKDLGQVKAQASAGAATDQKMGTILSGYPEATSAPQTIHTAMDYIRGSFRQNVARGEQLNSYRQAHPDLTGFQHADDILTSHIDPLMSEFQALKTPQERIGFYKRNFTSPQEAQAFKDKVSGASHALGQ